MNAKIAAVLILPEDTSLLLTYVAGRPVADYLLGALNDWDEAVVRVAGPLDVRSYAMLEKFPRITECRLADLGTEGREGSGLMIFDGRGWFSRVALAALASRSQRTARSLKLIEADASIFAAHRQAMALAIYLAAKDLDRIQLAGERIGSGQGLEQFIDSATFSSAESIEGDELDSAHSALAVVSAADRAELERRVLLARAVAAMRQGVLIRDPATIYIRGDLTCAAGVEIHPNVIIEGAVALGQGVSIGANSILRNCRIGDNTRINPFSLVEQSSVGGGGFVGPYGRIRPGCVIGDNVQIGNYVEIKNSQVGDGCRINHHSFIGDARLAHKVTIGAGAITCNHDGASTNNTVIERGAYIGSGCNLVAPLHIGEYAVVGAGSTIVADVPAAKLTLARERQVTVDGWTGPKSRREKE